MEMIVLSLTGAYSVYMSQTSKGLHCHLHQVTTIQYLLQYQSPHLLMMADLPNLTMLEGPLEGEEEVPVID